MKAPVLAPAAAALPAFRSANFDWTLQLRSVWRDAPHHVDELHEDCTADLLDYFDDRTADPDPSPEPLGRVVVGPAGFGKTHLVGQLRRHIWQRDAWFILLDLVGVKDFWSSVALGFLNSLQVRRPDGNTQRDALIIRLADHVGLTAELEAMARDWPGEERALRLEVARRLSEALARGHGQEVVQHRDVLTALALLTSHDLDQQSIAHSWLQGMPLEAQDARAHGFFGRNEPIEVVRGVAWLMALVGPTLIAVDQIDAIVTAANARVQAGGSGSGDEQAEARSIVDQLAQGLMDLHEVKHRAVTLISCLEATWQVLEQTSGIPVVHRYQAPTHLNALPSQAAAKAMVASRLAEAYGRKGFKPPYATWPFTDAAFESAVGFSPRQLLRACEAHRLQCVAWREVRECRSFEAPAPETAKGKDTSSLDALFRKAFDAAQPGDLLTEPREADFRALFDEALRLLEKHLDLPDDVDVGVQPDPDQQRPALHGRLTFTFLKDGGREQHYCFRLLSHTHATAFQSRLRAAMTAAGIDTALSFRHLFLLRRGVPPAGPKTQALVQQFEAAGGKFIAPTDEDLKIFLALSQMAAQQLPDFDPWLKQARPLFKSPLFLAAGLCPPPFLGASPPPAPPGPEPQQGAPTQDKKHVAQPAPPSPVGARQLPVGRRLEGGVLGGPVLLAADLLPRHVGIFAGVGSGKTVLLRRMVEEAALLRIPAIVLDVNNDLSRLGDPWPQVPESFGPEDVEKAARYQAGVEVVIWTPGVSAGNPLSLNLLPDFVAIGGGSDAESRDERAAAVEMARATLGAYVTGGGQKGQLKQGVLADALRRFASRGGGSLDDLIGLLAALPEGCSPIGNAEKLAEEIANQLLATISTNPLLQASGPSLDPKLLFYGPDPARTRISVVNLAGLGSDAARQSFVNQLQMSLFTWIKQNPSPTGRLYVLDEAQNFAPSQESTACRASTKSLAAQARKYGLGMIFATQLPKGIDNALVSNCTTHVYGRMSSPATIQATQELMMSKGGAADDLARLKRGEFYFSTEGFEQPVKIQTPLCLSHHPANPPPPEEIVRRARETRVAAADPAAQPALDGA